MTAVRNAIIIGSGPAGCTAAVLAARAGLEPLVSAPGRTRLPEADWRKSVLRDVGHYPPR